MSTTVSRKSFLTSLGAASVGAGLLRFAPPAAAQDSDDSRGMPESMGPPDEWEGMRVQVYADFTQALAQELGNIQADEVDAAIRKAIMALIDAHGPEEGLTSGQAEALKIIVATSDAPIMPGFMRMGIGPGPGMMHGAMMHGGMMQGGMMNGAMMNGGMMQGGMMQGGANERRGMAQGQERGSRECGGDGQGGGQVSQCSLEPKRKHHDRSR